MVTERAADKVEIDTWYAFECARCEGAVVFHLRLTGACRTPLPHGHCPVCICRCPCKGTWDADENGFAEPPLPETDDDLDRLANEVSDLATRIASRSAAAVGLVKRHRDSRRRYRVDRERTSDR